MCAYKGGNLEEDIYTLRRKYSEITHDVKHILDSFQRLNAKGKREAVKRIEELTYVPQYLKENP